MRKLWIKDWQGVKPAVYNMYNDYQERGMEFSFEQFLRETGLDYKEAAIVLNVSYSTVASWGSTRRHPSYPKRKLMYELAKQYAKPSRLHSNAPAWKVPGSGINTGTHE
jgi:hypothetical protein